MIIVNQEESVMINFENIIDIHIDNAETNRRIYAKSNVAEYKLGEYKTEERTKEVLQEIVETFTNEEFFNIRKSSLNNLDELAEPKYILKPVSRPKIYEMPKD